ncbi:MAG: hypothetical protein OEX22_05215 [Cyclobacteriaceae bacterium]|nr:hypothetical protein [Cyclobacteriaceae bacterium]
MRIPSILKIPKHQRFNVEPRYYDPVKEDISQRTSRIKKELEASDNKETESENEYKTQIAGSFSGRIVKRDRSANFFQFLLIIVLTASSVGYLYFGDVALYLLGIFMLLFVYIKFKKSS